MEFVQPIRDKDKIEEIKQELLKSGYRDYLLFVAGINTGLRISDLLELKITDIRGKDHIIIREQKTGKQKRFLINDTLRQALNGYGIDRMNDNDYLFQSRKGQNQKLERNRAYTLLNRACKKVGIKDQIGTHTLRKTFGYHFYQQNKDVAMLQNLFNHSAPSVTLRYIGITDDMIDKSIKDFGL